jgi:hypothetical protein
MPIQITTISGLPSVPAVYAMRGGKGRGLHVAYVGIAGSLRARVEQHLVRRDSSVATGTSAVCLNPEYVTEVYWWEHPDLTKREVLEAAELVAFDVLDPALRSRGGITDRAKELHDSPEFLKKMRTLFSGEPTGQLTIPSLAGALEQIADLNERLADVESRLAKVEESPSKLRGRRLP